MQRLIGCYTFLLVIDSSSAPAVLQDCSLLSRPCQCLLQSHLHVIWGGSSAEESGKLGLWSWGQRLGVLSPRQCVGIDQFNLDSYWMSHEAPQALLWPLTQVRPCYLLLFWVCVWRGWTGSLLFLPQRIDSCPTWWGYHLGNSGPLSI